MKPPFVAAVVVTYNRSILLLECLAALVAQTRRPDLILVIDNASTDGTGERLRDGNWLDRPELRYIRLDDNLGGAGGFHHGIRHALDLGADRVWLMDDDALPEAPALGSLLSCADDARCIYGSAAVQGDELSWAMTASDPAIGRMTAVAQLPHLCEVGFLPFLGFLVSRATVELIGLPDAGYFIAADDLEYSLRARRAGCRIMLVGASRIRHPKSATYEMRVAGRTLTCLRLAPWKRYYDTRNRLLVARAYFGIGLWTQTLPSLLARLWGALRYETARGAQLKAFAAGLCDGLLGAKGRRHQLWGIKV